MDVGTQYDLNDIKTNTNTILETDMNAITTISYGYYFNTPELKISGTCYETYPCRHSVSMYGMPMTELGGDEIYKLLKINCLFLSI
jgi:hypothetical protein